MRILLILILALGLAGCAADLKKADSLSPLSTYADTRNRLLLNFHADPSVVGSPGWTRLTTAWREALREQAEAADYQLGTQAGGEPGALPATLLIVEVDRLHQVDAERGLGQGSLRVTVRFTDSQSGRLLGSRRYESASEQPAALDGQIAAISQEIIAELSGAQRIAKRDALVPDKLPAPAALVQRSPQSKPMAALDDQDQRLRELQQRKLPFDQYQSEYRRIMAQ